MIVSNKKLYVNKEEGFIGWSLRKDEFIEDCSDLDDIILFFSNGKMIITKLLIKNLLEKELYMQLFGKRVIIELFTI